MRPLFPWKSPQKTTNTNLQGEYTAQLLFSFFFLQSVSIPLAVLLDEDDFGAVSVDDQGAGMEDESEELDYGKIIH